ncbi:MAG: Calx-beta domain-containing protein, partial [Verrucomicrobiota bacterium]
MKAQHALFLLFSTHLLTAAPDTVDPTFAASAGQFFDASDFGTISSVLVQPDGKILFGSNEMSAQSGTLEVPLVRFNPDGSLDNTFFADNEPNGSDSGIYFDSAGWPEVHALGLQSDGKIIAAGVMQGVRNGTAASPTTEFPSQSIVRFNADGTIDTTLQTNGTLSWPVGGLNYIEELTVQPDDKIICVGGFGGFRDTPASAYTTRYGIARLNANGSLDTGFQIDPSEFGVPAGASLVRGWFRQATLDSCGNIYLAGLLEWGSQFSPSTLPVLARLYPDGTRDTGFNPTPPAGITDWQGVTISADGRILAYGITSSGNILQRYFDDGSLDNSFTLDPTAGQIDTRPLRLDGPFERILLAQNNAGSQSSLVRLISNGNLDNTFSATAQWTANPNGSQPGFFQNFTTGWNGTIYSGDGFDSVNGTSTNKVVAFEGNPSASSVTIDFRPLKALESQGTLYLTVTRTGDTTNAASANYSFTLTQASVNDLVPTPGSISWAAGEGGPKTIAVTITDDSFVEGDENLIFVLSALTNLTDLGGDSTTITIIDDEVAPSITSQPTSITVAQGNPASFSVAVTSPVPPTFQWRKDGIDIPGANSSTYSISSTSPTDEADYTVVVTNLTGSTTSSPATLTVLPPSASVDPTFTPAAGLQPNSLAILPDNSLIILDGNFSSGYTLKKILPDGSVDATFNPTFSLISGYSSLNIDAFPLPNGQFIISGNFADVNGTARPQLARLNADGTLDPTFDAALPNAFNSPISGVAVTSSGTVYYAFKPGGQAGGLRRALNDGSTDPSFNTAIASNTNGFLWALEELPDGSLLISHTSGSSFSFTRGITRLNSDGSDFPGFNSSTALFPQTTDFALLPDGSFAAARNTTLELYDPLGNVLDTFTFTDAITSVHYHRGRLIVTGPTEYNSTPIPGIARLSLDGTLDTNFPGGSGPNANVQNAAFDSSDRLVTFGTFTTWNGESRNRIARLTLDNPEIAFATLSSTANETDGTIAISLIRYGDNSSPASVTVTSTNGTASAPGDFTAVNQVVTWPANDSTPQTISVTLLDDSTLDGDLSFTLALSNPVDTLLVPGDHIINILDDDSLPTITQQPANTSTVLGLSASFAVTATSPPPDTEQRCRDGVAIPRAPTPPNNTATPTPPHHRAHTPA